MTSQDANGRQYEHLIRLVRVARGLEAGGYYNAAKLFWAKAFSDEIIASNEHGVPLTPDDLDREIQIAIDDLRATGVEPGLIAAVERGRQGARENRTIPSSEIPQVVTCRTCGEIILGHAPQRCPICGARALTFREFLPVYFLEALHPYEALAALASGPDEVEETVRGLSEKQMAQTPRPGEWAIRDVVWHILVAQGLLEGRVEKMLAEDNPSLEGVAAWAIEGEHSLLVQGMLERFRASRQRIVDRLTGLPAEDWWRTARHEEFVRFTILQEASYFARHERSHLPQIEAIRQVVNV